MKISQILWLFPFICFVGGYIGTRAFFYQPDLETPSLVGKHLYEAFALLSNYNLSPRLLDQKVDPDLPEGTVITQIPQPGQHIKKRQTVFLVLSKKPALAPAPPLVGKSVDEIKKIAAQSSYKIKIHPVPSIYPINQCIAQSPSAHKPLEHNVINVYISQNQSKLVIWPDFKNKKLSEVIEFLQAYTIEPHIMNGSHSSRARITDQRPVAGSLVTLNGDQPPYVQLHVR